MDTIRSNDFFPDPANAVWAGNRRRLLTCQTRVAMADPAFFAINPVASLSQWTDEELEQQGPLTHPVRYSAERDRFEVLEWADAFACIADQLNRPAARGYGRVSFPSHLATEAKAALQELLFGFGVSLSMASLTKAPSKHREVASELDIDPLKRPDATVSVTSRPRPVFTVYIATHMCRELLVPADMTVILPTFDGRSIDHTMGMSAFDVRLSGFDIIARMHKAISARLLSFRQVNETLRPEIGR